VGVSQREQQPRAQRPSNGHAPLGSTTHERNELRRDDIKEIVDSDVLDEATVELAQTLLVRDIPLGNLEDADWIEFKHLLENRFLEIKAEHPPQGSALQGKRRKVLLGDKRRNEKALTGAQLSELKRIKSVVLNRATRARDGWQQEKINERRETRITEEREQDNDDSGGLI
jgi:hypothetical protein